MLYAPKYPTHGSHPRDCHALLLFYFDGQYDNHRVTVGTWDPQTLRPAPTSVVVL